MANWLQASTTAHDYQINWDQADPASCTSIEHACSCQITSTILDVV